eukprot:1239328-Rhodomonas_salina.1
MLGSLAGVDVRRELPVEPPQPVMADILEKLSAAWIDSWSLGSVTKERSVHLFTVILTNLLNIPSMSELAKTRLNEISENLLRDPPLLETIQN